MEITVELTGEEIVVPPGEGCAGVGAVVEFRGVVRGEENGTAISALRYEAYQPMAENVMRQILRELAAASPCVSAEVVHRIGIVPAGATAIYLRLRSSHRGEAFRLLETFMNRLKEDVPIWKTEALP